MKRKGAKANAAKAAEIANAILRRRANHRIAIATALKFANRSKK